MRRFWLVPAMLVGAVLYAGLVPDSGLRTWWQLERRLSAARERVAEHEAEIAALEQAARDLDGEFAMEHAIRVDLGLARPGETVVLFSGSDSSSPWIP